MTTQLKLFFFLSTSILFGTSIHPLRSYAMVMEEESSADENSRKLQEAKELAKELKEAKTVTYDRELKIFNLNSKNEKYFQLQRDHLREIHNGLALKYFEMEHVIKRLLLARMMKTHAFLYGDPGGAKSAVARTVLSIPTLELARLPDNSLTIRRSQDFQDVFAIQLHQMTSDVAIKGYADFEKAKSMEQNAAAALSMRHLIHDEGTLVYFEKALLDEADKGNPIALAALLDVLNEKIAQHGPISLRVRTKTVICTSNMTLYEFIQVFKDQGMESTARALLDRLPFKVFVPNYITKPELRDLYARRVAADQEKASLDSLAHPAEYEESLKEVNKNPDLLPEVDFDFLQALVLNPGAVSVSVSAEDAALMRKVTDTVVDAMRTRFHERRAASEVASLSEEHPPVYYPPSICSTRNCGSYYRAMALSVYLDLLLLPEEKMPTSTLIGLVKNGIPFDIYSTWRLQDILLTAAPGDPSLVFVQTEDRKTRATLKYGPELDDLKKSIFDKRQEFMLQAISDERQEFHDVWEAAISKTAAQTQKSSGILASLLKGAGGHGNPSIEVFIQEMKGGSIAPGLGQ